MELEQQELAEIQRLSQEKEQEDRKLEKQKKEDEKKLRERLQLTSDEEERKRIEAQLNNLDTKIYS